LARRIRRSIGPLDLRAQAILRAVIEEYVTTATPVGSQALVDRYRLGVSSATVRNILAELELAGLLGHPHTSAGRIPTDAGYRWYVESIIDSAPLPEVEQLMIRHQFGQVEFASEHWFRLAASTIASMTHAAGLATPAKPATARVRRVDLVSINDHMASLVVVLREGSIKQSLVTLATVEDQAALTTVAAILNEIIAGRTTPEIAQALANLDPALPHADIVARVGERIERVLADYDRAAVEEVFSDGLLNVMGAPEFAHSEKLRRVFTALENRAYLGELVGNVAASGRVTVYIGVENEPPDMREVALVLAPYGRRDRAVGVVGVLGPTRLAYSEAIGTVRFVSGLMNELVDHLYN
jgi:heat-inducible transcriptional repressor